MGEQDSKVEDAYGLLTLRTEECDAVDDVEGEPAHSEEKKDESQRFSEIQLLVIVLVGVRMAGVQFLIVKLFVDYVEDLCIDNQHDQQRWEHPDEKVKIDHVVHPDDIFKLAGNEVGAVGAVGAVEAVLLEAASVVPA